MIAKMIKGKGFRGALEYDLRQEKGYLLATNMAGDDPRSLAQEFGQVRALRPNLSRAVCHVSLALAPGESLSDGQWQAVAKQYMEHMGFAENQYVATRHTDTEHQHMHLVINRVGLSGQVVSDSHDYKKQEVFMRSMEQQYGLSQVTASAEVSRKALTKGEVEHSLRSGQASVRMRLQKMLDAALQRASQLSSFVALLASQGVAVRLNQASTGAISGISFALDGVAMKGSDLGKGYTWNALQKRGLRHEQNKSDQGYERSGRHCGLFPPEPQPLGCGTTQNADGQYANQDARALGEECRNPEGTARAASGGERSIHSGEGVHKKRKKLSR